ncbi:hypothetical protein [Thaumasiovibrio sp. DFM-14]|uniref:hypothetical protein n=1 Tax=Thaumasiovibrio sp. DFM-14 TaxID=3384792 RepID=UPI0039A177CF
MLPLVIAIGPASTRGCPNVFAVCIKDLNGTSVYYEHLRLDSYEGDDPSITRLLTCEEAMPVINKIIGGRVIYIYDAGEALRTVFSICSSSFCAVSSKVAKTIEVKKLYAKAYGRINKSGNTVEFAMSTMCYHQSLKQDYGDPRRRCDNLIALLALIQSKTLKLYQSALQKPRDIRRPIDDRQFVAKRLLPPGLKQLGQIMVDDHGNEYPICMSRKGLSSDVVSMNAVKRDEVGQYAFFGVSVSGFGRYCHLVKRHQPKST